MKGNKRYKHIFDLFDKNGKRVGGCVYPSDSTEKPQIDVDWVVFEYSLYLGWCNENDDIFSGYCFEDNVKRDKKTSQLKRIIQNKVVNRNVALIEYKDTNYEGWPTYEDDCKFLGIEPCEEYLRLKKERDGKFESEWEKVIKDKEYFRKKYYGNEKKNI